MTDGNATSLLPVAFFISTCGVVAPEYDLCDMFVRIIKICIHLFAETGLPQLSSFCIFDLHRK